MNWQHLQAFVWLRWRLLVNGWRRAGTVNAVLMMIFTIGTLVTAIPLFIGSIVLGVYFIPKAEPVHLMYAWDGLIVLFLFFWTVGLVTELQRTEPLALSKFLHLPVSVNGAFLINYFSSLLRLSLIIFVPMMLGFSLALIYIKGISMLPVLPALGALLLMVTALTYQLQGWLAALMNNPRRRRTVVVALTGGLVLVAQLPNMLNLFSPWGIQQRADRSNALVKELAKLDRESQAQNLDAIEHLRRQNEVIDTNKVAGRRDDQARVKQWERTARIANMVLPFGWLPMGVVSAAEGNVLPSILGILGMTLIGSVSLWRAYGTTIGMYQGRATSRKGRAAAEPSSLATPRKKGTLLLEARIPGLSEPVSAIALGSFRSLLRSPEAKMMLLTPVIMVPIFGSMLLSGRRDIPELVRPMVALGGMILILFGLLQMMSNQFGFDRDGFRVFVLCSARRRDILLGKNLAFVPIAVVMALIVITIVQIACPMRWDHFLATFPQSVSMFLLFCVLVNFLSIYMPFHVAAGSLKPSAPKLSTVLAQVAMFTFLFPLTQGATLFPLGVEALLRFLGWPAGLPTYLALSLVECALIVVLYYFCLVWQGYLFQAREQKILESVTNRGP